jgi:hypothetical protein
MMELALLCLGISMGCSLLATIYFSIALALSNYNSKLETHGQWLLVATLVFFGLSWLLTEWQG